MRYLLFFLAIMAYHPFFGQNIYWASEVVAFSSELSPNEYSAAQILGPPDVLPGSGDNPCAWMPDRTSSKEEFITVKFPRQILVKRIAVAETFNPSAIVAIYGSLNNKDEQLLYKGNSQKLSIQGRLLNILPAKEIRIQYIKIVMNPSGVPGFQAIDAVAIADSEKDINHYINIPKIFNKSVIKTGLVKEINSKYDEIRPVINSEGQILYISRKYHPENVGGKYDASDIWFAQINDAKNSWQPPENLGKPVNNKFPNFLSSLISDNQAKYAIISNEYKGQTMKPGLSVSKIAASWGKPVPFRITDSYIMDLENDYFVSLDKNIMLISQERFDTEGRKDIFISFRKRGNIWSSPVPIQSINTAADEYSPSLNKTNDTLYFSSEGYSGFGNADVFFSVRKDSSFLKWTYPKNLGSMINSPGDEIYYHFPESGTKVYFARKTRDNYDIFSSDKPDYIGIRDYANSDTVDQSIAKIPSDSDNHQRMTLSQPEINLENDIEKPIEEEVQNDKRNLFGYVLSGIILSLLLIIAFIIIRKRKKTLPD